MYQSHPDVLHVLVADRMQQIRAELERSRLRRSNRQGARDRLKERRRRPSSP